MNSGFDSVVHVFPITFICRVVSASGRLAFFVRFRVCYCGIVYTERAWRKQQAGGGEGSKPSRKRDRRLLGKCKTGRFFSVRCFRGNESERGGCSLVVLAQ